MQKQKAKSKKQKAKIKNQNQKSKNPINPNNLDWSFVDMLCYDWYWAVAKRDIGKVKT